MFIRILIFVGAYFLATFGAGKLIQRLLSGYASEADLRDGLKHAGRYIGWLERFLILTFVLMEQVPSIGFLIAAKSVFRIGEVKNPAQRKLAEYILIGTLLSFASAILIGCLVKVVAQ
jgi:hypothetical protein